MKFRTDFVTNSSSSSFVAVRIEGDSRMFQYQAGWDYEIEDAEEMLHKLCHCETLSDILCLFNVSNDDLVMHTPNACIEDMRVQNVESVRVSTGCKMYGAEATEAIEDGYVAENAVYNDEGDIIEGTAIIFNLKDKTIAEVPSDEDDAYGA